MCIAGGVVGVSAYVGPTMLSASRYAVVVHDEQGARAIWDDPRLRPKEHDLRSSGEYCR
jgi:hypothetical protein